jgi:amino acid transporter
VAIIFTTLICMALIAVGNLTQLANTTVLLLLLVFTAVNVAVLVLRRDPVDHDHFVPRRSSRSSAPSCRSRSPC